MPDDLRPPGDDDGRGPDRHATWVSRLTTPVHRGFLALSLIDTVAVGLAVGGMVYLNQRTSPDHLPLLVASLASSVLVLFSLPGLDIARSWNVIAGQFIGALSGFLCVSVLGGHVAVAAGCSVALAFVLMRLANALHPPGAATAFIIAVVPADDGAKFLVFPVLAGAVTVTVFAWLVHVAERRLVDRDGGGLVDRDGGGVSPAPGPSVPPPAPDGVAP